SGSGLCPSCAQRAEPAARVGRLVLVLGAAGVPVLIAGILGLDARMCVAGAAVTGAAVFVHVLLALR
ncbi:MAG TPA: hypothetical protein VJ276_03735, partial [Thermoanaerobaculia bacterium]|nr:hypothetical protein [Thermoanaerobaculia bacterium]